jgi:hypothetical protein
MIQECNPQKSQIYKLDHFAQVSRIRDQEIRRLRRIADASTQVSRRLTPSRRADSRIFSYTMNELHLMW